MSRHPYTSLLIISLLLAAQPLIAQTISSDTGPAAAAREASSQQYRLGRLNIIGNTRTRLPVILWMIPLKEGDIFDLTRWELGLRQIGQSGLFEPVSPADVAFRYDEASGIVDVDLTLKERDHQRIDLSGGGGTVGGTSVGLDYGNINLTGRGDRLSARARAGNREQIYGATYSLTTVTRTPVRLDFSGSYQKLEFVDARSAEADRQPLFIERTGGASFGASFPILRSRYTFAAPTRLGIFYSFTTTNLSDAFPAPAASIVPGGETIRLASLTPLLLHDTLDRELDPRRGERLSLGLELSARALGGELSTLRPFVDYRWFMPLGRGGDEYAVTGREPQVFGVRLRLGHIAGVGRAFRPQTLSSVGGVPIFRRFFLGGETDVRGYDPNSIAPLARVDRFLLIEGNEPLLLSSNLRPVGGDTNLVVNAEYRLPLVWRFSAAAFFDLGASLNARGIEEERFETPTRIIPTDMPATLITTLRSPGSGERLPAYRVSLGGELRFHIPLLNLPLRLIFAANPNAQTRPPGTTLLAPERRFVFRFGFSRTL